jgi:acyl carrier protein
VTTNGIAAEVRRFVLARVEPSLAALSMTVTDTPHDYDLLAAGVIDSFGMVELIGDLEDRFGVELDFEDVEPETLTVVGRLSDYVAGLVEHRAR